RHTVEVEHKVDETFADESCHRRDQRGLCREVEVTDRGYLDTVTGSSLGAAQPGARAPEPYCGLPRRLQLVTTKARDPADRAQYPPFASRNAQSSWIVEPSYRGGRRSSL